MITLPHSAVSLLTLLATPAPQEPDSADAPLVELAMQLSEEHKVPGIAIARIRDGQVAWAVGIGVTDTESGRPVTPDTIFNVGSVSKAVAAWGFMTLVESGDVDLDAPIQESLTRWTLPESEFAAGDVTLRRLLSHTAGLSLHGYPGFTEEADLPTLEASLSGATGGRGDVRLIHAPGSKWQYSGGGYTIAQLMLEEQTGEPFADFMRQRVFDPLGMDRSDYGWTTRVSEGAAAPHDENGQPVPVEHFTALAAAGLQTTVRDMARFGVATLAVDDGATGGVLRPATVAMMRELVPPGAPRGGSGTGYQLMSLGGVTLVGHTGSNTGWEAALFVYPPKQEGIVVLTNGANGRAVMQPVCERWVRSLRQ